MKDPTEAILENLLKALINRLPDDQIRHLAARADQWLESQTTLNYHIIATLKKHHHDPSEPNNKESDPDFIHA